MSIPEIIETFRSGRVAPPGDATEEEIFQAIRVEAERAMLAAGSPPDHPLDDRIGRIVARRIWLLGHPEEPRSESSIEEEIREAVVIGDTQPEEEWRVAARCPNYEVSSLGRVRRCTRGPGTYPGKILSAPPDTHGYRQFQSGPARSRRNFLLHSLVAEAFLGSRPDGYVANHINRNKLDNRVENLEWVTPKENTIRGETTSWSKLNEQVVKVMRFMNRKYPKPGLYRLLARLHGVSDEAARFAITGRNWESVTDSCGKERF